MKVNNPAYIKGYIKENLHFILTQIFECYKRMLVDYEYVENNENKIKNRLYRDYLNNQEVRNELGLNNFIFKTETGFVDENYDEVGYSDFEIIDLKSSFYSTSAFYVVECKRLDGKNPNNKASLCNLYLKNGINRFVIEKYPTNFGVNGMIGFFIEKTDIQKQCKFFNDFKKAAFSDSHENFYRSEHLTISKKHISLYHLMLDFSDKIKPPHKSEVD